MLFGNRGQSLLVLQERHSRLILAQPMFHKSAQPIADAMVDLLSGIPPQWRQTVAFDNGSEFAEHHQLHSLGIKTFFCDTHSPWQKGGVENANGRLRRRYLPSKTDLHQVPSENILQVIQTCNNTPRKCLDYRTPRRLSGASSGGSTAGIIYRPCWCREKNGATPRTCRNRWEFRLVRCSGFSPRPAAEVYSNHVLHLKCERTFRPAPE